MNIKRCFLGAVVVLVLGSANSFAQPYDFFWSSQDLHSGAVNADTVLEVAENSEVTLYLYVSTHKYFSIGPGAFIDISTSEEDVIEFTDAFSYDFSINVGDIPISNRWVDNDGGGGSHGHTGIVTPNFIDEFHAFTVTGGVGILRSNNGSGAFLDQGYDFGADAFLFGRVEFVSVGQGTISLQVVPGDGMVIANGNQAIVPNVGAVTINVTKGVLRGDVNRDGIVNLADVAPFVELLADLEFQAEADVNADGLLNSLDIPPFVDLLID